VAWWKNLTGAVVGAVVVAAAVAGVPAAQGGACFWDIEDSAIADLQRRMETDNPTLRLTSRLLVEKYLCRIGETDLGLRGVHSIIDLNSTGATAAADQLDAERREGHTRGPLHGIPIVLKDNIDTGDGMQTTAGSLALEGSPAAADAFIVTRLRAAGAIILGKTNMSEWANFRSTHSSSGWSARGAQTRNPYALDRNPSGSSSGSGAAVAASFAAAGIGTETDGSIVSPSSLASLVGIKPTLGLVSRTGIIPIAHSQDTAGPMARTVTDAALLLGVMAGTDPRDPATKDADRKGQRDYTRYLDRDGLRGARIGVVRNRLFGYSPSADRLAEAAIDGMKRQGAVIVDPANIPTLGKFDDSEFDVLLYEFKADLNAYLASRAASSPGLAVRSLKDVIAFNNAHRQQELRFFGQEIMEMAEKKGPLTERKYKQELAQNLRLARTQGIDAVMNKYKLDALVAPTGGPAWLIDLINGDGGTASAPGPSTVAAVAGYPHITVPMGFVAELPVGLSFFGRAWSEPTLIRLAYAYEQATRHRRPPRLAASATRPQEYINR
jgi:amidase